MTEMYTPADAADDDRDYNQWCDTHQLHHGPCADRKIGDAVAHATRPPVQLIGAARGYVLEGFLRDPRDDSVVVLLHRPFDALDPYVTGRVDRLTDAEWRHGHYFGNVRAAARSMIRRAGVDVE